MFGSLAAIRWRVPRVARFVRSTSTSQKPRQEDLDIIRRLRRQERITAATLDAEIDDFLQRFDTFVNSRLSSGEAVNTAMRQNKYISTERLSHSKNLAQFGQEIIDHFNDYKMHIKDLDEEPYPEWQPGDSDVVLRQLDDPNLKPGDLESELKTRHKDVKRLLDQADDHYDALVRTREALREKGVAAAEAVADKFVNSHSSDFDFANFNIPLDPVDLDTIDEDTSAILAPLRRKTP
jgi:hypothetical protein